MPKLNISEAARAAGKSRGTVYRAIKTGKLRAITHPDGSTVIDSDEIERVYGIRNRIDLPNSPSSSTPAVDTQNSGSPYITIPLEEHQKLISRVSELERDKFELYGILLDYRRMLDALVKSSDSVETLRDAVTATIDSDENRVPSHFPFEITPSHSEQLRQIAKTPTRRLPRSDDHEEGKKHRGVPTHVTQKPSNIKR